MYIFEDFKYSLNNSSNDSIEVTVVMMNSMQALSRVKYSVSMGKISIKPWNLGRANNATIFYRGD